MPLYHHFHQSRENPRISFRKPSLALIKRPLMFSGVLGVVEEDIGWVGTWVLLEGQGWGGGTWLEDGSRPRQCCHPQSWRVFCSYFWGWSVQPFHGKRPRRMDSLGKTIRLQTWPFFKEVCPGLLGGSICFPKPFPHISPHNNPGNEVRCYSHLPSDQMEDLRSLLEGLRAGQEFRVLPTFLGTKLCPSSPLTSGPSRWTKAECVAWALASWTLTCLPGTIEWCVWWREGEGTLYQPNALWPSWPRDS